MSRCAMLVLCCCAAIAQQPRNPAYDPVVEDPKLPRVLLIGDSISIGYTVAVREALRGKANVLRIPVNAATTANTLAHIDEWLGAAKWDVIHVNCGLHDLKIMDGGLRQVPLTDYEANVEKLLARLRQTGAKVIWATTTPVPAGKVSPPRKPADVALYNTAALRVAQRYGVAVNDLYSGVLPKLAEYQQPVNVHYNERGYAFLGQLTAEAVAKALR